MLRSQLQAKWAKKGIKKAIVSFSKKRKFNRLSKIAAITGREANKPELKFVDFNGGGSAPIITLVSTTATFGLLNDLVVGANAYQRIGRTVLMQNLHVRGAFYPSGNAGTVAGEYIRLVVVYDRQANGAAPSYSDIFQSTDAAGNTSSGAFDYPRISNAERFVILADEHFNWCATATNGTGGILAQAASVQNQNQDTRFDRFIPLKGIPVSYTGAGGSGAASIASGALYFVTIGSNAAATAGSTFNWTARLRYTDA